MGEKDDILRRIRAGKRVAQFETVRLTKDGRRMDVSLALAPPRNAAGEIVGASKIARDMTPQKKAGEAEAYFAAIMESSTDAIVAMRLSGTITACNESGGRIYGYAPRAPPPSARAASRTSSSRWSRTSCERR